MMAVKTVITIILKVFVLHIFISYVESYNLTCPPQANWKTRAKMMCNSTLKYFCLYNNVEGTYVEGCNGPDYDRKGSKRIFSGSFTRGKCKERRFQPFTFWTNGSSSDCIYDKSLCSEEGQIVYKDDSTKDDITCGCNYRKNYSFIKNPRNRCYCIPTEEDCSCYIRSCPANLTLSGDYDCIQSAYQGNQSCTDYKLFEALDGTTPNQKENTVFSQIEIPSKLVLRFTASVLCSLCVILIGGFVLCKWISEKLQTVQMYSLKEQIDESKVTRAAEILVDVGERINPESADILLFDQENCMSNQTAADGYKVDIKTNAAVEGKYLVSYENTPVDTNPISIKKDEVNFLKIVHLLFRVACPVVRLKFNYEIHPKKLRKMLDHNRLVMEMQYKKKDANISRYQWDLLYKQSEGELVTSDDFDLRLMIRLLGTLAEITIGEKYPETTDTSESAMLSRIKFIRNEATRKLKGKLSEKLFIQYWDDIAQAILKLVPSRTVCNDSDPDKKRLLGRLLALNPTYINITKLCEFIDMSERYPAMILQQLIYEYCNIKDVTIEQVLMENKHDLYHKKIKTHSCCKCTESCSSYDKVISEKQWNELYKLKDVSDSHFCTFDIKNCSESFVPKHINTCDLSVAKVLILHIPNILTYMIDRLCKSGFNEFLMQSQHILYHLMETKLCCICNDSPIEKNEKSLINENEWHKLFMKSDKSCEAGSKDCCCQYVVRNGTKYSDVDVTFLSKVFKEAGPIGVLNKIKQDACLYLLNWTVDEQHLQIVLTELLNMIQDENFKSDMRQNISCFAGSRSKRSLATKDEACEWASRNLRQIQASREPPLYIPILEKDGLNVKGVHIPKEFRLPNIKRKFTDISSEENNFLLVVFGLTSIVAPLIKTHFSRHCPNDVIDEMHQDIYGQQKRISFSQNEQQQLFTSNNDPWKDMDLRLMIKILKRRSGCKGKKQFGLHLDIIYNISREIIQSSCGILSKTRCRQIFQSISQAVLYLGGTFDQENLLKLQHIQNILE